MMTKEQYIESLRKLNLKSISWEKLISNPVDHPMIRRHEFSGHDL